MTQQNGPDIVVNLTEASRLAQVSVPTLRRLLQNGTLKGEKTEGPNGATWAIALEDLAAVVQDRYHHGLRPYRPRPQRRQEGYRGTVQVTESAAELRQRLDDVLVELGKYRALTERAESASADVERILKDRIAELERELERERSRSWLGKLFGRQRGGAR